MVTKRSWSAFDSDRTDSYILLGTAPATDDAQFVPLWKQDARDDHGRRRFHGAFTGGWSAGYFNSAGSKEGWTPTSFRSSRADRHRHQNDGRPLHRAEDYMDDEDLADLKESETLRLSGVGDPANNGRQSISSPDGSSSLSYVLRDIEASIGQLLLQRMGWKAGQGIGRKVRRSARLEDLDGATPSTTPSAQTYLFAPADAELGSLEHVGGMAGLGYADHDPNHRVPSWQGGVAAASRLRGQISCPRRGVINVGAWVDSESGDEEDGGFDLGPRIRRLTKRPPPKLKSEALTGSSSLTVPSQPAKSSLRHVGPHRSYASVSGFTVSDPEVDTDTAWYPPPAVPSGWIAGTKRSPATTTFMQRGDASRDKGLDFSLPQERHNGEPEPRPGSLYSGQESMLVGNSYRRAPQRSAGVSPGERVPPPTASNGSQNQAVASIMSRFTKSSSHLADSQAQPREGSPGTFEVAPEALGRTIEEFHPSPLLRKRFGCGTA